ncbi:hypothetical protein FRC07_013610 [Ceratobasidium sp. 392]|nr:hypothetical protein FRC07_013610 [Ceratobasidium sp. 392]
MADSTRQCTAELKPSGDLIRFKTNDVGTGYTFTSHHAAPGETGIPLEGLAQIVGGAPLGNENSYTVSSSGSDILVEIKSGPETQIIIPFTNVASPFPEGKHEGPGSTSTIT